MTTARIHISEWHFGDERWIFDLGAPVRLRCNLLGSEKRAWMLQLWDEQTLRDVSYTVDDGTAEHAHLLRGVITGIQALECRYPSRNGGHPIPHSGTAHHVRQARGWTGDVDYRNGIVMGFLIDLEQSA